MPDDYYVSQYSGEEIDERLTAAHNAVRYDAAQTLTDAQKTQARANIAAAPDGFGLGATAKFLTSADDANDIWQSGWYRYYSGNIPQNGITLSYLHVMRVDGYSSGVFVQTVYGLTDNANYQIFSVARRFRYGTKITPWEYENPPMIPGKEYRTTERYLGKPVYKKLLLFTGAMKDGYSGMEHNIANIANVVGCYAELFVSSSTFSTPILDGNDMIIFSAHSSKIRKTSVGDNSAYSARILMSYTKTTD